LPSGGRGDAAENEPTATPRRRPRPRPPTWRRPPGPPTPSVSRRSGPSGSLLHEEVSEHGGGSLGGRYYFASADPADRYGKKYPGLVRPADLPSDLGADAAKRFCGNVGKSAAGAFDDCQIWGYRARYGQYVAYLELTDMRLSRSDIAAMAKRFDAAVTAALPK
jgi:hypothetical protein